MAGAGARSNTHMALATLRLSEVDFLALCEKSLRMELVFGRIFGFDKGQGVGMLKSSAGEKGRGAGKKKDGDEELRPPNLSLDAHTEGDGKVVEGGEGLR